MRTPVVRDLFLKFMGLTFIAWLLAGVWQLLPVTVSIWDAVKTMQSTGATGTGFQGREIAILAMGAGLPWIIYGPLIWLFLFRTDAVARKLWPKDRTVGVAPLAGDGQLTVGVVVLLFGLYLLIPGLAELLAATGIVLESQDLASRAFTMGWTTFFPALSKVIVGAACIRWPHRIETFIVQSWQPKPALALALDNDDLDDPEVNATS